MCQTGLLGVIVATGVVHIEIVLLPLFVLSPLPRFLPRWTISYPFWTKEVFVLCSFGTRRLQYAIDCSPYPKSYEALRQLLHKHGVHPVSSSRVNILNEETRTMPGRPWRITISLYAVGPYLCRAQRRSTGGMLHIAVRQRPICMF